MRTAWTACVGTRLLVKKSSLRTRSPVAEGARMSLSGREQIVKQDVFTEGMMFGPHKIDGSQVFFQSMSGMTAGFVNLRPIVPGHVLITPVRNALKLHHMSEEEVIDLWLSAREIGGKLEKHYQGEALNYAIQDGPAAGQSVPHVHIHILPRRKDDFERNDDVYEELEHHKAFYVPGEGERRNRSKEEMAQEALDLRALFSKDS